MSNKSPGTFMVKLIRGASFVTPGQKFVPGDAVPVSDPKLIEVLKRSQQFKITDVDEVEEDEDSETSESGDGDPTPPQKKKRKRR